MSLTVQERGEHVATFRYVQVKLMETLAQWVPTTPEMEVKLLLGTHIWDLAQHADLLGKRTYELRLPLQFSLQPSTPYIDNLEELAGVKDTAQRIAGFYQVMLPAVGARLQKYLDATDSLMDAPTVRVIERILQDQSRMIRESEQLCDELPKLKTVERTWVEHFERMERSVENFVVPRRTTESVASRAV